MAREVVAVRSVLVPAAFAPSSAARSTAHRWAQRALHWDLEVGRHGVEAERLADEGAERDDQLGGVHRSPGDQLPRRPLGEPHVLLGAEQDDIGERRFHGIIGDRDVTPAPDAPAGFEQGWTMIRLE